MPGNGFSLIFTGQRMSLAHVGAKRCSQAGLDYKKSVMAKDKIVDLIDQFSAQTEYAKQMAILLELRRALAEEKERLTKRTQLNSTSTR